MSRPRRARLGAGHERSAPRAYPNPRATSPAKIIHARHDNVAPYEQGRLLATRIAGARLVTLETENHIPVPDDPAWGRLMDEIEAFASGG